MTNLITRNVTVLDLSDPRKISIPQIYYVPLSIIKLKHKTIDIGAYCYSVREVDKNGVANKSVKNSQNIPVTRVSLASIDETRIPLVRKIVEYIAHISSSVSQATMENNLKLLISFSRFYWRQTDLDYLRLENKAHYEEASKRYSAGVDGNKKIASAYKFQLTNAVFVFAQYVYGEDVNALNYGVISNNGQRRISATKPLLPNDYELSLALRSTIFECVVDLLVNNKCLPHPLKVPKECNEPNDTIWLGYAPWSGPVPFPRSKNFEKYKPAEWFNRSSGKVVTREEWFKMPCHKNRRQAQQAWRIAQNSLETINRDHSNLKMSLAEYASSCFLDALLSMTGMNLQPALDLPWFGGYIVQKSVQGKKNVIFVTAQDKKKFDASENSSVYLRSIKHRKGYQPVEVTIKNRFLKTFEKYLLLREYYLDGKSDTRLFPFRRKQLANRRSYLVSVFPEIPKLGPRVIKASMSDEILSNTNDPYATAKILQNSPRTVIKHYAAGTQKGHIKGMGGFFNDLGDQIKVDQKVGIKEIETSVGRCDNGGGDPDPLPDAPIESNCVQQEGCFFCKHYCIHADEVDVRKLISVLYYVNKGAVRAYNVDFFNSQFGLLIKRIKSLLKQIEGISMEKKQLVSRIRKEVYTEEELDEFWLRKLNRFEILIGER